MNILYHHRTQGKGVERVHIMGLVNGLRELGHQVEIIGPPWAEPESHLNESIEETSNNRKSNWNILSKYLPEFLFELMEMAYNAYAYFNLSRHLRKRRVDAVDAIFERYALFMFAGVLVARTHGCPIILEINDAADIERVRTLKFKNIARGLEKTIFKKADALNHHIVLF